MFNKILVANRGEIACRIMRTARALGYRTVAVFSDADEQAPHVMQADEAVRIGPAPAAMSYLAIDALLAAARASAADAVHPGYGFLSERADFAQACHDAGLVFIGPPPSAISAMGDKAGAKRRMIAAGVPCAPGYLGDEQDETRLVAEAQVLGYPLLVKAVAGGGGRGMRLVREAHELAAALAGARREAQSAFGDGRLMLERMISGGRHIEIQVFADAQGRAVHLGERDCSAQRRRQKVIEESPSPIVDAAMRLALGRDAVAAALAVGYVGAGTVEFIVDAALRHYFLEMNTRLQVEHPVTECVTGLDLVEWQLRIAAGEPLPLAQHQIAFSGHAIEARLYAEDPYDGFSPQSGRIRHWQPQAALQPGLRIDHGISEGSEITPYYDAMVAKLIVHGRDRADAMRRLRAALENTPLLGPAHNGRFLRDLLGHPAFAAAAMTTSLIDEWAAGGEPLLQRPQPDDCAWLLAAAARVQRGGPAAARAASVATWGLTLQCQGQRRVMRVTALGNTVTLALTGLGDPPATDAHTHTLRTLQRDGARWCVELDGVRRWVVLHDDGEQLQLAWLGATFTFSEPSPLPRDERASDPRLVRSPVAGVVAQIAVRPGDRVSAGQPLLCVEAMKMEMWQSAGAAGTVAELPVKPGDAVASGSLLVKLILEETSP